MTREQRGVSTPPDELIGGAFAVEAGMMLPATGTGTPCHKVRDLKQGRTGLMAVRVAPGAPPRPRPLLVLSATAIDGLLCPIAHGVGAVGAGFDQFVVCQAPSAPPLAENGAITRRWNEPELIGCVLRPIGAALAALQGFGLTHRAIRPDNVFQSRPGQPVVLGTAWSAPPGLLQPPSFEPAYMAICHPAGRGEGTIADDVYALGVLLVALAAGQMPMAGLSAAEVARRKISLGSYPALSAGLGLPQGVAELARSLLSDDPDHRPSPQLLHDVEAVRGRRLAVRPARVAPRPFELGGVQGQGRPQAQSEGQGQGQAAQAQAQTQTQAQTQGEAAWHARGLAAALAGAPGAAVMNLRDGSVCRWLRRGLGEGTLAARVEELLRTRDMAPASDDGADGQLVMHAVAVLDPLAPVSWRGLAFWPDGLGALLAGADPEQRAAIGRLIQTEAMAGWAEIRAGRADPASLRASAREWRLLAGRTDWGGGLATLAAQLNPLERCASRTLGGYPAISPAELILRLDQVARGGPAATEAGRSGPERALPIDREAAAYLAGSQQLHLGREVAALDPEQRGAALAQLRLLARLQTQLRLPPLPGLGGWLAAALLPEAGKLRGLLRRGRLEAELQAQAAAGSLPGLLACVEDETERDADLREAEAARAALARIDAELAAIEREGDSRALRAHRAGQEVAAALAVAAAASVAASLLL